jgi:ABC-type nickel/cobalt efflux system permease component RcnA
MGCRNFKSAALGGLSSIGRGKTLLAGLAALVLVTIAAHAWAAPSPFGIATPDSTGGFGGPLAPLFAWIALRQAEFYRVLTKSLADIKENGWATWLLLLVSFAYGVFHAAGPGHGKAVISAYVVSSGEKVRHGVAVSFAAAFVQAFSAIAVVAVAAVIFRVTARSMTVATQWVEVASYALITAVGAWLLWQKLTGGGHHHHHDHHAVIADDAAHRKTGLQNRKNEHQSGGKNHQYAATKPYNLPPTEATTGGRGLLRAWSAILAVGIRPCSGAIIILVFALAQGLFVAGVAATLVMAVGTGLTVALLATMAVSARGLAVRLAGTQSRLASGLIRTIEIAAAAAVLLLGLLLLGGALSSGLPG